MPNRVCLFQEHTKWREWLSFCGGMVAGGDFCCIFVNVIISVLSMCRLVSLLLVLTMGFGVCRGEVVVPDSAGRSEFPFCGVALMGAGAVIGFEQKGFRSGGAEYRSHSSSVVEDYGRVAPLALTAVLKACGVETRSSWGRMAAGSALSAAIMFSAVEGLKHGVREMRPDVSDGRSFPSGHTTTAFMCAAVMSHELEWRSPWYSVGAYSFASSIALLRVMGNHHWVDDVVFGAGVGMASVDLGYFLADLIFKDKGLNPAYGAGDEQWCVGAPSFFATGMAGGSGASLRNSLGLKMKMGATTSAFLEGAGFLSRNIGVGGRLRAMACPIQTDGADESAAMMGCFVLEGGAYGALPVGRRLSLGAKLLAGARIIPAFGFYCDGAEVITASSSAAFEGCAGVSLTWQARAHSGVRVFADYALSRPRISFNGAAPVATLMHDFSLGLSYIALF